MFYSQRSSKSRPKSFHRTAWKSTFLNSSIKLRRQGISVPFGDSISLIKEFKNESESSRTISQNLKENYQGQVVKFSVFCTSRTVALGSSQQVSLLGHCPHMIKTSALQPWGGRGFISLYHQLRSYEQLLSYGEAQSIFFKVRLLVDYPEPSSHN